MWKGQDIYENYIFKKDKPFHKLNTIMIIKYLQQNGWFKVLLFLVKETLQSNINTEMNFIIKNIYKL